MIRLRPAGQPRPRMRGFSLVELTVVLVVLGLVSILLVRFLMTANEEQREVAGRDLLTRADDALLAFAMVNGRLPCPARAGGGTEDCSVGQLGTLPYATLGLPDANARRIRYGVLRRAADRKVDADLAVRLDRFDPMQVIAGGVATELPMGHVNGIDLCWALRTAQQATANAAYVHVTRPDAPASMADNVAYALALPRDGGFTSHQAGSTPAFDSPRRPRSATYRDHVVAVGLDQMWARMRCGDNLAAASHAHFNAAASIALMHQSLRDYKAQLAIAEKLADANVANGAAAVLGAAAGVASAAGGVADTVSEGLASTGVVAYRIALGAVATAAAVAVGVTSAFVVDAAVEAQDAAEAAHRDIDPLIATAATLEPSVLEHARAADAAGLY